MVDLLLPLRAIQFLFAIISLGLNGYVSHKFNDLYDDGESHSPSRVNFMIFNAVWSMVVVLYLGLGPMLASSLTHKFATLALDALTMLFWFAGFIALAAWRGDTLDGCSDRICNTISAAAAFGAFEWLLFAITTALAALHVLNNRGGTSKPAAHEGGGGLAA